jgi:hypothetical protein
MSPRDWASTTPEDIVAAVTTGENPHFTRCVLRRLSVDPVWTPHIIQLIEQRRVEIRSLLSWLARELQPVNYLEVGVRRGFSMAMVAARCPDAALYGFDLWIRNYAGVPNPGPRFVRSELRRLGHRGPVYLVSGNSHRTLAAFLDLPRKTIMQRMSPRPRIPRPARFDLITIDGDHSLLGAHQDLRDTMPFCALGGAVVFDDIAPHAPPEALRAERGADPYAWGDLRGVWHAVQREFPNFRYFDFLEAPGVGLAVRMS